ncbi:DUF4041 domain-containing protein [Lactococcus garvieae]|uniref:DUF4041 domain-containing protein n=1 Tax=Lactococcus garvieae TaxID=1363 RepID=UPI0023EE080C|nr:DUF4041 domain-containing protein [Lactococcus garvieae]
MGIFNVFKSKDTVLTEKLECLEKDLTSKQKIFEELTEKLQVAQRIEELEKMSERKTEEINKKNTEIQTLNTSIYLTSQIIDLEKALTDKKDELDALLNDINIANGEMYHQEYGFFKRRYKFSDSLKYKEELSNLRSQEKALVKNGYAGIIETPMLLDGSSSKGKTMQKQLIKAAIRGFNGEADALLTKISVSNVEHKRSALVKAYTQLNKMYARNAISISPKYLKLKEEELQLAAEFEYQKQEEKDALREQREREREDKKLQAEIKKQQVKFDKDIKQFKNAIAIAEDKLKTATDLELEELKKQIADYKYKIESLNDSKEELTTTFSNAKAGYVYVISNVGSFGEGIVKIGVTRRLTPTDRVDELGSASVPFKFAINTLIFNDDAFDLETRLHKHFDKNRINKFNNRKEYFKVDLNEIKSYLATDSSLNVEWNENPENFEYEQTLLLEKNQ